MQGCTHGAHTRGAHMGLTLRGTHMGLTHGAHTQGHNTGVNAEAHTWGTHMGCTHEAGPEVELTPGRQPAIWIRPARVELGWSLVFWGDPGQVSEDGRMKLPPPIQILPTIKVIPEAPGDVKRKATAPELPITGLP